MPWIDRSFPASDLVGQFDSRNRKVLLTYSIPAAACRHEQIFSVVTNLSRIFGVTYDLRSKVACQPGNSFLLVRTCEASRSASIAATANTAWRFATASIETKIRRIGCAVTVAALVLCPEISRADESGISFWLPGQEGSLAATPTTPGWSMAVIYYHTSVNATGAAAAAREFQVGRFSPTVRLEHLADVRDLGGCADGGDANQTPDNEIG